MHGINKCETHYTYCILLNALENPKLLSMLNMLKKAPFFFHSIVLANWVSVVPIEVVTWSQVVPIVA